MVNNNNSSNVDNEAATSYNPISVNGTEGASAKIDRLLTIQEVCNLLKVKETYVYWLTHQRKIPHIKMQGHLRFRESSINRWLESQEVC
jgi:excisionase family DNA binding protein